MAEHDFIADASIPVPSISVEDCCAEIVRELASLAKQEVFAYLVALGKELPSLGVDYRDDAYLVKGCVSRAWLIPKAHGERVYFFLDSEALIVKGILSLLRRVYHGRRPEEILAVTSDFWKDTGITMILSMNRRNGIAHMLKQIRLYALSAPYLPPLVQRHAPPQESL